MRARNIKPGFFLNDVLAQLPYEARLLYVGLWCFADREGRFEWRPLRIKAAILPYDNVDVESLLDLLQRAGFILFYERDGMACGLIPNFVRHQRPHPHEARSKLPEPPHLCHDMSLNVITCNDKAGHEENGFDFSQNSENDLSGNSQPNQCHDMSLNVTKCRSDTRNPDTRNSSTKTPYISPAAGDDIPCREIINLYHEILPELPQVMKLTDGRIRSIRARWLEDRSRQSLGWWRSYFVSVRSQAHLMGENGRGWRADLDFLVKKNKLIRVLEGAYRNNVNTRTSSDLRRALDD